MIEVLDPGGLTTIQDAGRPGLAHLGVPPSGAADAPAHRLANRLVGNAEDAAALETTLRGPVLRFHRPALIALAGAPVEATAGGRPLAMHAGEHVPAGVELRLGLARVGVRTYLAVRGGIAAPETLGSAATDLLTGLGPAPLRAGDRLAIADRAGPWPPVAIAPVAAVPRGAPLRVIPGPRDDWLAPDALERLCGEAWSVAASANRIGVRLDGPPLRRAREGELESEGMVAGALQVPPAGRPILLLADHPVTGGYPVLAVVVAADMPRAAQLRPGDHVRFTVEVAPASP